MLPVFVGCEVLSLGHRQLSPFQLCQGSISGLTGRVKRALRRVRRYLQMRNDEEANSYHWFLFFMVEGEGCSISLIIEFTWVFCWALVISLSTLSALLSTSIKVSSACSADFNASSALERAPFKQLKPTSNNIEVVYIFVYLRIFHRILLLRTNRRRARQWTFLRHTPEFNYSLSYFKLSMSLVGSILELLTPGSQWRRQFRSICGCFEPEFGQIDRGWKQKKVTVHS